MSDTSQDAWRQGDDESQECSGALAPDGDSASPHVPGSPLQPQRHSRCRGRLGGRCHRSVGWGPGNNAGEEEELSAGRGRGKERGGENSREGGRHHQRVGPVTSPGLARCGKEGLQLEWAHGPLWAARFSRWGLLFCGLDEGTGSENHTFTQPPN